MKSDRLVSSWLSSLVMLTCWCLDCLSSLRCSLNLMSLLNSQDSLNSRSFKRKKRMSNCLSMLQNIWSICFKRFLLIALSVVFTWNMSVFRVHDYRCSSRIVFYLLTQRILQCDVCLRRLIVKSSFHIYILTRFEYLSWIFWLNLNTWVESHDSTQYWSRVESKLADSTWLIKQSNMTSRELNIEIFPVFRLCIIFLHYLFDRKS